MSEDTKPEEAEPTKANPKLVKLQQDVKADWTLSIDGIDYPVVDGVVEVPEWHVGRARQAGFH